MAGSYVLEVDWNNDDDFSDTGEDVTAYVVSVECFRGRDYASQLTGRSSAGRLRAVLRNVSGRFSSFNSSGPLYGNLLPNRKVRFRSTGPTAATLWTGFLSGPPMPTMSPGDTPMATLEAVGALAILGNPNTKINPAALESVQTGDVVDAILDAAGWPVGDRSIDTGDVPVGRWYVEDKGALEALQEMEETELGFVYEGLAWDIVFKSRYDRLINQGTSQATFSDAAGASLGYQGIIQDDPLREIFNDITATVQPYTEQSIAVLWTLADVPFTLGPSLSITYVAQYPNASQGGAQGAYVDTWSTPVVGTDITQTGVSDGDIGVSVVKSANRMAITITNNHGSANATITLMQAQGTAVTKGDPYQVTASDSTSQGKYGLRSYPLASIWYSNGAYGQAACDYFISRQKDPRPLIDLTFVGGASSTAFAQAVNRSLGQRITVVANNRTAMGLSGDFHIESIAHSVSSNSLLQTTWQLSPGETSGQYYWILGDSTYGVLDSTTKLAY